MKFSTRIWLMAIVSLLCLLIMGSVGLYSVHESMMEVRKVQMNQLLNFANGQLNYFHELEKAGKMTREEAQTKAKEAIGSMRHKGDYFFVRDLSNNVMLVHPIADRVGKADDGGKMKDGRSLVQTYKDELANSKDGKALIWGAAQRSKEDKALYPKLSGIGLFGPWNWLVGTGFFLDDLNDFYWKQAGIVIGFGLALLVALGGLIFSMRKGHSAPAGR